MVLNLLIMGLPGAGKGTQAEFITDKYGIKHISTGDILRKAINNHTPLGKEAQSIINKGELVPDNVMGKIVQSALQNKEAETKGYLLDGFPRNLNQAQQLKKITTEINEPIDAVLYISMDPNTIIKRLSSRFICKNCGATYNKLSKKPVLAGTCDNCGSHVFYQRSDDKPATVKKRLEVNEKNNAPVIDFYNKQGKLYKIDGAKDIHEVNKKIENLISQLK